MRCSARWGSTPKATWQAALVARLTAFMSGERGGGGGPGFTVVAELEAAGVDAELGVWQASADRLGELQASLVRTLEECEQQHAAHKTAVASVLDLCTIHNRILGDVALGADSFAIGEAHLAAVSPPGDWVLIRRRHQRLGVDPPPPTT